MEPCCLNCNAFRNPFRKNAGGHCNLMPVGVKLASTDHWCRQWEEDEEVIVDPTEQEDADDLTGE